MRVIDMKMKKGQGGTVGAVAEDGNGVFRWAGCGSDMIGPVSPARLWPEAGQQERKEEKDEEQGNNQDCEEATRVRVIKAACAPCQQEIEDHTATRMSFRSWCPFCVAGETVSSGHHRKPEGPGLVPMISIDYAFRGNRASE